MKASLARITALLLLTAPTTSGREGIFTTHHNRKYEQSVQTLEEEEDNYGKQQCESARRELAESNDDGYGINQEALVKCLEPSLEKKPMLETIRHMSTAFVNRNAFSPSGVAAAKWLHSFWEGYAKDRSDVTVEMYKHEGYDQPSVILTIPGTTFPDEFVILGAHLDTASYHCDLSTKVDWSTCEEPGADDDASGVAVISEVIRVATSEDFKPQRTVQFMAFGIEEFNLTGSRDIADNYKASGINVVAMLTFDVVLNQFGKADIVFPIFTPSEVLGFLPDISFDSLQLELQCFLGQLIDTYQPELLWAMMMSYASDHISFIEAGYPATVATANRYLKPEFPFVSTNVVVHTMFDSLECYDDDSIDNAYKFARLALAFMVEVGNVKATTTIKKACKAPHHHGPSPPPHLTAAFGVGALATILFVAYKRKIRTAEDSDAETVPKSIHLLTA